MRVVPSGTGAVSPVAMMTTNPIVRAAPRFGRSLIVLALAGGAAVSVTGCESVGPKRTGGSGYTTEVSDRVAAPSLDLGALDGGNLGGASDVVFPSPQVSNYYIAIKPEVLEELRRRDHELAIYDPAPITALANEWPTSPRPSLDEERILRTRTASDRTFIYYGLERAPRR